jgi:hypothetical protein
MIVKKKRKYTKHLIVDEMMTVLLSFQLAIPHYDPEGKEFY